MQYSFFRKISPRIVIIVVVLIAAFIIHSCKKDNSTKTQTISADVMVSMAKQWYNAKYPETPGAGNLVTQSIGGAPGKQDWSQMFSPYWQKASTYLIDSLTFIELPALKKGNMAMSL